MTQPLLRLAFRVEGGFWNAYVADMDSMEGAVFLGSCSMTAAKDTEVKQAFMDLMRKSFEVVSKIDVSHWGAPRPAPDNERGGSA